MAVRRPGRSDLTFIPGRIGGTLDPERSPDEEGAYWYEAEAQLEDYPGFEVRVKIRSLEGNVEVVDVRVYKAPARAVHKVAAGPVTTRMLRAVPLGAIQQHALEALAAASSASWLPEGSVAPFRDNPYPGRRGRDDLEYALLAAKYVAWVARSRTPMRDLAAAEYMSVKTLKNKVTEARYRELLTRSGRGTAGGELTEKARRLLREAEEHGLR